MKFYSPAFQNEMPIPQKYAYDGSDCSIPLAWEGVPAGTQSLAFIMDDPDAPAGTWVHWVVYNIPPSQSGLKEDQPKDKQLTGGGLQGLNSSNYSGYEGPRPPSGTHRYFFKLYALDHMLAQNAGMNKKELLEAMQGHIIEQAEFYGTYSKRK